MKRQLINKIKIFFILISMTACSADPNFSGKKAAAEEINSPLEDDLNPGEIIILSQPIEIEVDNVIEGTIDIVDDVENDQDPGNLDTGSGNTDTGPGDLDNGSGNTDTGPGDLDNGSGNTDTGPGDLDTGNGNTQNTTPPSCTVAKTLNINKFTYYPNRRVKFQMNYTGTVDSAKLEDHVITGSTQQKFIELNSSTEVTVRGEVKGLSQTKTCQIKQEMTSAQYGLQLELIRYSTSDGQTGLVNITFNGTNIDSDLEFVRLENITTDSRVSFGSPVTESKNFKVKMPVTYPYHGQNIVRINGLSVTAVLKSKQSNQEFRVPINYYLELYPTP